MASYNQLAIVCITLSHIITANNCIAREKGLYAIETKYVTTYFWKYQEHVFCQINDWQTPGHMYCKHQCNGYASERVAWLCCHFFSIFFFCFSQRFVTICLHALPRSLESRLCVCYFTSIITDFLSRKFSKSSILKW